MRIGAHVSAAGGAWNAPANAKSLGCEVFQIFSRPPRGGNAPELTKDVVAKFQSAMKEYGYKDFVIHTPYFINFASSTPRIRYGSIKVVREELERGTKLGASYVVTHLGSTKDVGKKVGIHKTWRAIQRIYAGYKGTTQLLLEISAGAGELVGGTFEELGEILKMAKIKGVGVCWDTCHLFAAGYDIRTRASLNKVLAAFDKTVGLKNLKLVHANDSKFDLGKHADRHEHIGLGKIGTAGFKTFVTHPKLKNVDLILETPWDDKLPKDIATLKKLRRP